MEGKGKTDMEKSFRIDDLLQRKIIDPDMPIELTTFKRQPFSPPIQVSSKIKRDLASTSPLPSRSKSSPKSHQSSCCNVSPVSSGTRSPDINHANETLPANSYFSGYPSPYQITGHYPTFTPHFPTIFGGTNPPTSLENNSSSHPHQFIGRPPTSQDSLFFHHHPPPHHRLHHHYHPDFSLWHGPNVTGSSLITPYVDPRPYDYKYPASTLFTSLACGSEYMTGRGGLYPLLHGESKRKGGQIRFSNAQTSQLEKTFVKQQYQNAHERRKLAHSLGLTDRQVKTWFQNRRAKWRKLGINTDAPEKNTLAGFSENLKQALDRSSATNEGKSRRYE